MVKAALQVNEKGMTTADFQIWTELINIIDKNGKIGDETLKIQSDQARLHSGVELSR